jgi:hypothetical protein
MQHDCPGRDFWQARIVSTHHLGEQGLLFAIAFVLTPTLAASFFAAAHKSGPRWLWDKEEDKETKNVIRSDGYCRIELLGSHPGGAGEEDQPPVVRNMA